MPVIYADRVKDTSTSTGNSTFTLSGTPPTNFRTFASGIGANYCYYTIAHKTLNEWEVGLGSVSGTTLTRVTIYSSSNSNSVVTFSAGTKDVFVTVPSSQLLPNATVLPGGRLTLTSETPITTSDVSDSLNIYYTPYTSNFIHLYDGYAWKPYAFDEVTLSVNYGSPAQTLPRDIFIYDNAGTLTMEAVAWSTDTARVTNLALQDGIYVKSGTPTRRYLGTARNNGAGFSDTVVYRGVWNMYNRVHKYLFKADNTSSWTYGSTTVRAANGSSSNSVACTSGIAGDCVHLNVRHNFRNTTAGATARTGIGVNSTSSYEGSSVAYINARVTSVNQVVNGVLSYNSPLGHTVYYWLEESSATGTSTFNESGGTDQTGLSGFCSC